MKSSLRSATLSFSGSLPRLFYRLASCGRIAPILLLSATLFFPRGGEAGLARVAISIPTDQNLAVGLKAGEQCKVPDKLIVLPPVSFDFAGSESPASFFDEEAINSLPEGSEVWLHVLVEASSLTGKESEQEITERVDAFVKSMPLSAVVARGLVVEIREPLKRPDLFTFGLVRLALAVKGRKNGFRVGIIFFVGVPRAHWEF